MCSLTRSAFITPSLKAKKSKIDFDSIDKLVELAIKTKCYGIVIMGVMGEAHRLTENERNDENHRKY